MLNITHYQSNANQNHNEVSSHASQNVCHQKTQKPLGWRGCGEKGTLSHCWWECKLVEPLQRTVWRFLKKLEIELPYNPAISLDIHTKETRTERNTYTPMFIAALYNSQDMEATQMSIGRQMDKEAVVHIHNGILLGYEKGTHLSQFY